MSTVVAPVVVRQSDPSETSSSTSTRSDAFSNANVSTLLAALAPEAIVVYGVATDFCDRYTVEGLLRDSPGTELFLVTDAIRAIYPEEGARLVAQWKELGVRLVTSAEVLAGRILPGYLPADV